jgi:hypothetical protein
MAGDAICHSDSESFRFKLCESLNKMLSKFLNFIALQFFFTIHDCCKKRTGGVLQMIWVLVVLFHEYIRFIGEIFSRLHVEGCHYIETQQVRCLLLVKQHCHRSCFMFVMLSLREAFLSTYLPSTLFPVQN